MSMICDYDCFHCRYPDCMRGESEGVSGRQAEIAISKLGLNRYATKAKARAAEKERKKRLRAAGASVDYSEIIRGLIGL